MSRPSFEELVADVQDYMEHELGMAYDRGTIALMLECPHDIFDGQCVHCCFFSDELSVVEAGRKESAQFHGPLA